MDFYCECLTDFKLPEGKDKLKNKEECEAVPICDSTANTCPKKSTECVPHEGNFYCECLTDFKLPESKDKLKNKEECDAVPICDSTANTCPKKSTRCVPHEMDFYCECLTDFKLPEGKDKLKNKEECEAVPICDSTANICPKKSTRCVPHEGNFYCECLTGFKLPEGKEKLKNKEECEVSIDPCKPNPCKYGGICSSDGKTYKCQCISDITGDNCENCTKRCGEAECEFGLFFYCKCKNNKIFNENFKNCTDPDKCILEKLKGKCQGRHEKCEEGKCTCEENYNYSVKEQKCKAKCPCDENKEDCKHSETGAAYCVCKPGYYTTGKSCEKIDTCTSMKPPCTQECNNGICSCYDGYKLSSDNHTCELKKDTETCDLNCSPGKCIMREGKKECVCPEKTHYSNKTNCIDLCTAKRLSHGICPDDKCTADQKHGFKCECKGIFKPASDGIHCERKQMCIEEDKKAECSKFNARCEEHDSDVGYRCKCIDGYTNSSNYCIHKCETKVSLEATRKRNVICVLNENYEPVFKCPPLFEEDGEKICSKKAKYSFSAHFTFPRKTYEKSPRSYTRRSKREVAAVNNIKLYKDLDKSLKTFYGNNYGDFLILQCKNKAKELICDVEIKFKSDPEISEKLNSIASKCNPIGNEGYCSVKTENNENVIMKMPTKDFFKATDPCEENVKNIVCSSLHICEKSDSNEDFHCTCKKGYRPIKSLPLFQGEESSMDNCEDVDECKNSTNLCSGKNTICQNTPGDYKCQCMFGYRNKSMDIKKDGCIGVCDHTLCKNGKCVQAGDNGFACVCEDHYTGFYCNVTNVAVKEMKKAGTVQAAIIGGVLGGVLLVVLIAGFIYYRRNMKKTDDDGDYTKHRERAIREERQRQGFRQRQDDIERRQRRQSPERRESGDYRNYRNSETHIIPRAQIPHSSDRPLPEMTDASRLNEDDDKRSSKTHSGRYNEEVARDQRRQNAESSHRSLARSSEQLDQNGRRISVVQYKNRGYEED